MAAEKGRNMLLKIGNGLSPQTFTSVAGLQSRSIVINNELVDITNDDTAPWREALSGAGLKTATITANGVFKGTATAVTAFENIAFASASNEEEFQISFENGDNFQGTFHVASYEYSGEFNGARLFNSTLESVGVLVFSRA